MMMTTTVRTEGCPQPVSQMNHHRLYPPRHPRPHPQPQLQQQRRYSPWKGQRLYNRVGLAPQRVRAWSRVAGRLVRHSNPGSRFTIRRRFELSKKKRTMKCLGKTDSAQNVKIETVAIQTQPQKRSRDVE